MPTPDSTDIARLMLRRHGLQARAVAFERMQEMRIAGDIAGLDRWAQVLAAIANRRYTAAPSPAAGTAADRADRPTA